LRAHPQPPRDRGDRRVLRRVIARVLAHQPDRLSLRVLVILDWHERDILPKLGSMHETRGGSPNPGGHPDPRPEPRASANTPDPDVVRGVLDVLRHHTGALGGTRTPNLLIRRIGQLVHGCLLTLVASAVVPLLMPRDDRRRPGWQQYWQQGARAVR